MGHREFRTNESYTAERETRSMLKEFLENRGFTAVQDIRRSYGKTESQTIYAETPDGTLLAMRVRLCWRRTGQGSSERTYSAAQLRARIKGNDWEGTLQNLVKKAKLEGATHFLIVQREDKDITCAALIPLSELVNAWCAQRDISQLLIDQGRLGRRKKNHAMNGSSPTLWLKDDKAPEVAAALWDRTGVKDLTTLQMVSPTGNRQTDSDDTFDDMPWPDYSLLGSDGGPLMIRRQSYVRRDHRVRRVVLERAQGRCERKGCEATRSYSGFLDVHHILGAEKSDRVWNCVALCPNCHRESHAAPHRNRINKDLLRFTVRFKDHTCIIQGDTG